ncbi:hypothetical protein BD779DRAFT_1471122 [Infundibulicybe gibba]|nr:hypothetical protein BD779DRAFT_1471122 [Infundibulicybe gibba]
MPINRLPHDIAFQIASNLDSKSLRAFAKAWKPMDTALKSGQASYDQIRVGLRELGMLAGPQTAPLYAQPSVGYYHAMLIHSGWSILQYAELLQVRLADYTDGHSRLKWMYDSKARLGSAALGESGGCLYIVNRSTTCWNIRIFLFPSARVGQQYGHIHWAVPYPIRGMESRMGVGEMQIMGDRLGMTIFSDTFDKDGVTPLSRVFVLDFRKRDLLLGDDRDGKPTSDGFLFLNNNLVLVKHRTRLQLQSLDEPPKYEYECPTLQFDIPDGGLIVHTRPYRLDFIPNVARTSMVRPSATTAFYPDPSKNLVGLRGQYIFPDGSTRERLWLYRPKSVEFDQGGPLIWNCPVGASNYTLIGQRLLWTRSTAGRTEIMIEDFNKLSPERYPRGEHRHATDQTWRARTEAKRENPSFNLGEEAAMFTHCTVNYSCRAIATEDHLITIPVFHSSYLLLQGNKF